MITDKNKEQFEKWYNNLALFQDIKNGILPSHYELFKSYPLEMQIGVYLAYYDSLGYYIHISPFKADNEIVYYVQFLGKLGSTINIKYCDGWSLSHHRANTRNEAYKEAFKKADELVNNQQNK